MTRMKSFSGLLVALTLAALALPAVAADKLFLVVAKTYSVSGTTVTEIGSAIPTGGTTILLLEYQNQSPNGANSVMKSIKAYIPTDVTFAYAGSKSLNVSNANPSVSCDAPPASYASITPTTPGLGANFSTASYTQNSITGVKPRGKFCLYLAVTSNGAVACEATTWKLEANTGNSFTGGVNFSDYNVFMANQTDQPFTLTSTTDGCTGILGCGVPSGNNQGGNLGGSVNHNPPLAFVGFPDWGLERAKKNKDGLACTISVPYQFNFSSTTSPQTAEFIVPDTKGEGVAVEYVLLWSPIPTASVPIASPGLPYPRLELGWLKDGNVWLYRPALACKDDDVEQVDGSPLPTIPYLPPFSDGCESEEDLSGCTQPPGYQPFATAKMCVAQEGSTSVGGNPSNTQFWHKVIDFADGGVRLSE